MANPGLLALGGVLALIGFGAVRSGLRAGRIGDRIEEARRVDPGEVGSGEARPGDGPVLVTGTVEPAGEALVHPPDGGDDCVVHRLAVEYEGEMSADDDDLDGTSARRQSVWRWNYDHVDHVPFRVVGPGGDVRVELPEEWDGSRTEDHELVDAAFGEDDRTVYETGERFPDWLRSYVADSSELYDEETGGGLSHNALNPDVRRRVSRRLVRPGDEVTVVGDVDEDDEDGATVTGDPTVGSMLVSVRDPAALPDGGSGRVRTLVGAFLLGWAALMVYAGL